MKTIAVAYIVLVGILMGSATVLVSAKVLFCTQNTSPAWCESIDKITDTFTGY